MFRPSWLVIVHRLDPVAVGERVCQVAQLAADPGGDDGPLVLEQFGRGRARRDHPLFRFGGIAFDDHSQV